jgi:hypothetical protein
MTMAGTTRRLGISQVPIFMGENSVSSFMFLSFVKRADRYH